MYFFYGQFDLQETAITYIYIIYIIIGVCLRSSTSPAWPVPTERTVGGGHGRRWRLYIWYCIINTINGDSRSI